MFVGQIIELLDGQDHLLGEVLVEEIQGNLVLGTIAPKPDFARVEPLFTEFVEAANQQLLYRVDELDSAIAALGLRLRLSDGVPLQDLYDLQIADYNVSFRVSENNTTNGASPLRTGSLKQS